MPTLTALERRLDRAGVRLKQLCDRRRPPPLLSPVELAQAAGIEPDPWQAAMLLSASPRILTLCSRQAGKSTISAVLAVHQALYEPGSLVLLLSPSLRQSSELFKKCAAVYQAVAKPVPPAAESALQLQLENGSRLVSLPGKSETIRGYSGVRLLIIDEGAFVPDGLYLAVRPMLAVSGGRLLALSTPWGTRGWFFDAFEHGGEGWERYRVTAYECPRISPEFLDEERRAMGDEFFAAEYLCTFLDSQRQVFRREDIDAALAAGEGMETWDSVTGTVTMGVDIGQRRDPTAICVAEDEQRLRPGREAGEETHFLVRYLERLPLGTPYPQAAQRVKAIAAAVTVRTGCYPRLYVDATGVGLPVVDLLRVADMEATIYATFFTHGERRTEEGYEVKLGKAWLVSRLQALLQTGRLHLPNTSEARALAEELRTFEIRIDQNALDRYGAFRVGSHDDLVTALGLATQADRPWLMGNAWPDITRAYGPSIMRGRLTNWR